MKNGPNRPFVKLVTLILVGVWAVLVLDVTPAEPSMWLLMTFTAFIFSLVGRMWGVEADHWLGKINPITISLGNNDEDDQ
jgi:hypothetical protein